MIKILKVIGLVVLLVVVGYGTYILYLSFYPYLANNSGPGAKRVAEMAVANNDLEACGKIKTYPFPLFISGFDVTKNEIISSCYWDLAALREDKAICNNTRPYTSNSDGYVKSCEQNVSVTISQRLTWGEVFFVFTDAHGAIVNLPAQLQEATACKPGATCNPPLLFSGLTDKSGKLMVLASAMHGEFNIIVSGHSTAGPFRVIKADHPTYTLQYPDGSTHTLDARSDTIAVSL